MVLRVRGIEHDLYLGQILYCVQNESVIKLTKVLVSKSNPKARFTLVSKKVSEISIGIAASFIDVEVVSATPTTIPKPVKSENKLIDNSCSQQPCMDGFDTQTAV